jgi:hypothetical protein
MTVTGLPHTSSNVQLTDSEVQTIFGWSANQLVRPPAPDGGSWAPGSNEGWQDANRSHYDAASSLVEANLRGFNGELGGTHYRLVVSPEVAASLRSSALYWFSNVLNYTAGTDDQGEYVDIPLGNDSSAGTSNESRGSTFRRKYHVDTIRIRPNVQGVALEQA